MELDFSNPSLLTDVIEFVRKDSIELVYTDSAYMHRDRDTIEDPFLTDEGKEFIHNLNNRGIEYVIITRKKSHLKGLNEYIYTLSPYVFRGSTTIATKDYIIVNTRIPKHMTRGARLDYRNIFNIYDPKGKSVYMFFFMGLDSGRVAERMGTTRTVFKAHVANVPSNTRGTEVNLDNFTVTADKELLNVIAGRQIKQEKVSKMKFLNLGSEEVKGSHVVAQCTYGKLVKGESHKAYAFKIDTELALTLSEQFKENFDTWSAGEECEASTMLTIPVLAVIATERGEDLVCINSLVLRDITDDDAMDNYDKAFSWVVGTVNTKPLGLKIANAKRAKVIKKELERAVEEQKETEIYALLAKNNPVIAKMLTDLATLEGTTPVLPMTKDSE